MFVYGCLYGVWWQRAIVGQRLVVQCPAARPAALTGWGRNVCRSLMAHGGAVAVSQSPTTLRGGETPPQSGLTLARRVKPPKLVCDTPCNPRFALQHALPYRGRARARGPVSGRRGVVISFGSLPGKDGRGPHKSQEPGPTKPRARLDQGLAPLAFAAGQIHAAKAIRSCLHAGPVRSPDPARQ